mmetsp:Transcript_82871/g.208800  ORF Transcript_82871/g.208800 Transcript_82871/m.208800 type:complete len:278 (-) Transcript_82871:136-969(-)
MLPMLAPEATSKSPESASEISGTFDLTMRTSALGLVSTPSGPPRVTPSSSIMPSTLDAPMSLVTLAPPLSFTDLLFSTLTLVTAAPPVMVTKPDPLDSTLPTSAPSVMVMLPESKSDTSNTVLLLMTALPEFVKSIGPIFEPPLISKLPELRKVTCPSSAPCTVMLLSGLPSTFSPPLMSVSGPSMRRSAPPETITEPIVVTPRMWQRPSSTRMSLVVLPRVSNSPGRHSTGAALPVFSPAPERSCDDWSAEDGAWRRSVACTREISGSGALLGQSG